MASHVHVGCNTWLTIECFNTPANLQQQCITWSNVILGKHIVGQNPWCHNKNSPTFRCCWGRSSTKAMRENKLVQGLNWSAVNPEKAVAIIYRIRPRPGGVQHASTRSCKTWNCCIDRNYFSILMFFMRCFVIPRYKQCMESVKSISTGSNYGKC